MSTNRKLSKLQKISITKYHETVKKNYTVQHDSDEPQVDPEYLKYDRNNWRTNF